MNSLLGLNKLAGKCSSRYIFSTFWFLIDDDWESIILKQMEGQRVHTAGDRKLRCLPAAWGSYGMYVFQVVMLGFTII
jgi:hypothetical protein